MKRALIAGATGMVGSLVLEYCLASEKISEVIVLSRKSLSNTHSKIEEVIIADFKDYSKQKAYFRNIDFACFCIGAYTGKVSDAKFAEITIDYAVAFAQMLKDQSPNACLCLLSGAGADRTEKSRISFAKYKGIAENRISALQLGAFHTFRPSYIYPVQAREEPNIMYRISRFLYPVIKLVGKDASIQSTELAQAMFNVGLNGAEKEILENRDILKYV